MHNLKTALQDPIWQQHQIGNTYQMNNVGGKPDINIWKIAYYPLTGTYKSEQWVDFDEPRALVETTLPNGRGTDFREVPLRYLNKIN